MNDKSIEGTFNHDNRKAADSWKRRANCANRRQVYRARHHIKDALRWWRRTHRLSQKIITGEIE